MTFYMQHFASSRIVI